MPTEDTQIKKGQRLSPATEFKPGEHWRPRQPFWDAEWLRHEYLDLGRSTGDIAKQFRVSDGAIASWLKKHGIPRRSVAEARALKHWGLSGSDNGMYGKRGPEMPNWKGGCTPERQAFYSSEAWANAILTVARRDLGVCQRCGAHPIGRRRIHIHHIAPFAIKELRAEPSNLVTLCSICHRWVHSKRNVGKDFIKEGR